VLFVVTLVYSKALAWWRFRYSSMLHVMHICMAVVSGFDMTKPIEKQLPTKMDA
jgi:hypothetical protein